MVEVTQVVAEALADGFQVNPEAFKLLQSFTGRLDLVQLFKQVMITKRETNPSGSVIITKQDLEACLPSGFSEKEVIEECDTAEADLELQVEILKDPTEKISPIQGVQGFQKLFMSRYSKLLSIVKQRPNTFYEKISEIKVGKGRHRVAGLVLSKKMKKGRGEIVVDDETGKLDVALLDDETRKSVSDLLLDQLAVVEFEFSKRGDVIGKSVYPPDTPDRVLSLSKKRVYALLLSDLHLGSKTFLYDAFQRLILWLCGNIEHEDITHRVKYVVIAGDVVDGVGIYPGQESDLDEPDIYKQFIRLSKLLELIPKNVKVFIIPGNHDPTRQALPQPAIPRKYAEPLYRLENVTLLGNPTNLRLNGVNTLVYHGRSLDDVIGVVPGLTVTRPALAMKVLLKARHLAPIYGGRTAIAPEPEDHLVIEDVPDVFHSGHIHVLDSEQYKGTLIVNSGTWQAQTGYQANMGIEPTPGIVPVVDLSTLNVMVRDFTKITNISTKL